MADWDARLVELLGRDARDDAVDLLKLQKALTDDQVSVADRLQLLDWVGRLGRRRQAFLLPRLLELLSNPAKPVRMRMLAVARDLVGDPRGVFTSLLALARGGRDVARDVAQ